MHAPPAFEMALADAPLWRGVQVLVWALAGAGLAAWLLTPFPDLAGGQAYGAVAVAGAASAAAGWRVSRGMRGWLRWTGRAWEMREGSAAGLQVHKTGPWREAHVRAMLDMNDFMLLRVQPAGARRARWVGLSTADAGPAGHLLRAAVYCAPSEDRGRADEDSARS